MAEDRWTSHAIAIAFLMVITGSINTLAAKWADKLEAPAGRPFDHPFVQAVCMFIGEFLCLPAFFVARGCLRWRRRRRRRAGDLAADLGPIGDDDADDADEAKPFNPLIFLPAAMCDMCATSIMYVGLNMTNASSFQMLRGSVVVFTGLLSVAFLRSVLRCFKWIGMALVVAGLVVVGLSDILFGEGFGDKDINSVITGDLLIVMSQVVVAVQMVYEQRFVVKYDVPALLAVGLEGLFGALVLTTLLVPMYFIHVPATFSHSPQHRLEDAIDAITQMGNNPLIIVALVGTITSIAFFNFAGISVTKELSATTRMILDSVRTIIIWAVSLGLGWQAFAYLQIVGFVLLILGMFVYNDLVLGPLYRNRLLPALERAGVRPSLCLYSCCNVDDSDQQVLTRSLEEPDD